MERPRRCQQEMRLSTAGLLVLLSHFVLTGAWDVNFKTSECYRYGLDNLEERMPITIGNLVALIEKMEGAHTYVNPDAIAEALVHRYRSDGITYANPVSNTHWEPNDNHEINKAHLLRSLVTMDQTVPEFTFEPREECSLHFMLSHSVDLYPHAGLDYVWENTRVRREAPLQGRYGLPVNIKPATHPIENGVIWTPAGPVAAGTLLAGIMITDVSQGMTISQIYQSQNLEFMPDAMTQKRVIPLHAATLAGDIGQSALIGYVAQVSSNEIFLGPVGLFANSTIAPKLFTLGRNFNLNVPYLTRAEVFAGIDSLLIQKVLRESNNNQLSLSEALRMYYSNYGLPGYPDYKACNRMSAFKTLNMDTIKEQALHFMYAYSEKIASVRNKMYEHKDDFPAIESAFKSALEKAWNAFINTVDNYNYDPSEYEGCPTYTSNEILCENKVDLLVVYGYEGGETETQKERDYVGHLGQLLDVGVDRSRLGVLDGKSAKWIFPMTNFSNVADWASNFSESITHSYGSGSDMVAVLAELNNYYNQFYAHMHSDAKNASANAQVVLWNVPASVPDPENFKQLMEDFRLKYPDVYILFVGRTKGNFNDLMIDPIQDFFTNNGDNMEAFAKTLAKRICKIPTVFTYPSCNPENANFTSVAENSHVYTGYISPNYTTYIKISPMYFLYSESVLLKVSEGDVSVCGSRTSINVEDNQEDRRCDEGNNLEWWFMCYNELKDCDPIYLAVKGTSVQTNINCQDVECQYPNQIKFQIHHEGMTCGAWSAPPSLLLLLLAALLILIQRQY